MTKSEFLHLNLQLVKESSMFFINPDDDRDEMTEPDLDEEYPEDVYEDEEGEYYDEYLEDEEEPDTAFEDETPPDEAAEDESIEEPIPDTSEEEGREYITYDEV